MPAGQLSTLGAGLLPIEPPEGAQSVVSNSKHGHQHRNRCTMHPERDTMLCAEWTASVANRHACLMRLWVEAAPELQLLWRTGEVDEMHTIHRPLASDVVLRRFFPVWQARGI